MKNHVKFFLYENVYKCIYFERNIFLRYKEIQYKVMEIFVSFNYKLFLL